MASGVDGPGSLIQSDYRDEDGGHGRLEVIVPIGGAFRHFWRDNSNFEWHLGTSKGITDSAAGWGSFIQGSSGGAHGNFEVLVEECPESITHYWRPNEELDLPWMRPVKGRSSASRLRSSSRARSASCS